jgi:hypothetical protein
MVARVDIELYISENRIEVNLQILALSSGEFIVAFPLQGDSLWLKS